MQIFKSIFELLCTEKAFWASWEVKSRSRSPKVIRCKFSNNIFLRSYVQKKHFGHRNSSSGQGHQRSSSANFQKCIFELLCTEKALWVSWEVKIISRRCQGYQRSSSANFQKSLFLSSYAQKKTFWT